MDYKTPFTIFGLPLVHIKTGKMEEGRYRRGIARGWIAIGDISFGIVLSVGGAAFGTIAVGGFSLGVLSLAGLATGVFAIGGGAVGFIAFGGGAFGWHAALGGFAMAVDYARGGMAIARHGNDTVAVHYFNNSYFFPTISFLAAYARWLPALLVIPVIMGIRKNKNKRS